MTMQWPDTLMLADFRVDVHLPERLTDNHPQLRKATGEEAQWLLNCSACQREYIATWEVRERRLCLVGAEGIYAKVNEQPIFADWMSGEATVLLGRVLRSCGDGPWLPICEQDLRISFSKGVVQRATLTDYGSNCPEEVWKEARGHPHKVKIVTPSGGKWRFAEFPAIDRADAEEALGPIEDVAPSTNWWAKWGGEVPF